MRSEGAVLILIKQDSEQMVKLTRRFPMAEEAAVRAALKTSNEYSDIERVFRQRTSIQKAGKGSEIDSSLLRDEASFLARPNCMESRSDVNERMRAILVDWLVALH